MEKERNKTGGHRAQPTVRHTKHSERTVCEKAWQPRARVPVPSTKQQLVGPELGFYISDVKSIIRISLRFALSYGLIPHILWRRAVDDISLRSVFLKSYTKGAGRHRPA